jgi:hypothetical protein
VEEIAAIPLAKTSASPKSSRLATATFSASSVRFDHRE